ncbi:hypothetical protein D3C87_1836560 [compost metagenome]
MLLINKSIDVATPLHHVIDFGELQIFFVFAVDRLLAQLRLDIMEIGQAVAIAHND